MGETILGVEAAAELARRGAPSPGVVPRREPPTLRALTAPRLTIDAPHEEP